MAIKRTNISPAAKRFFGVLVTMTAFAALPLSAVAAEGDSGVEVPAQQAEVNRKLTGTVVDKKTKEKLYGVNVAVWQKGKLLTGVATGYEGEFAIDAPAGAYELHVSYIGYKTIVIKSSNLNKTTGIEIVMSEDDNMLEEAVITGFFAKNKTTFTGAVTQIKGEDLKMVTGVNVINAIAALTPGMQLVENTAMGSNPNHVPELVMRGMTSFSNSGQEVNQPTIILDGSEISMQELYDLDMNEIDQINVLKDASATALYGSKAANGVIVITRKPIKESTLRVAYNFTGNVQVPKLDDYQVLNAWEKLEYERLAGLYTSTQTDLDARIKEQYELDNQYNEIYKRIAAGQNSDWLSQPARTSFSQDHSLRVYGGAANLRYELSGRFADTRGVMKDDYRKRYSLGFKLDYFINNKIQISNRATYQEVSSQDTPYGSFSQYVLMNPYERMYNADGSANTDLKWDADNPLYEAMLGSYDRSKTNTFSNSTDVRWDINKEFRLTGHFNLSSSMGTSDVFLSPNSRQFKNETDLSKRGSYDKQDSKSTSYNGNIVATYNKMFRDESLIGVNAGWEINHSDNKYEYYRAIGFFNDNLSFVGNAASYPETGSPYGSLSEKADVGMFISGNYSYRNRYFVDGTWRMTGSSQFGKNNRYGHFWSAGAGWNILNEKFMDAWRHKVDLMKLRGSMGYTGKVSFSAFQALTMYQYSNSYEYKNGIGAVPLTIGNIDLTWERTMTYNIGFDFSMFGRRLNVVVDAYLRNTTDLLLDKTKAPSTGVTEATSNLGELQNKGIEFQVDGYIFRNQDFQWKIGTTGYMNRNKITKINKSLEELNKQNAQVSSSTPLPQYAEGESTTALKLVRSAGIDPATGKEVYIKKNGELTFTYDSADKVLIGDTEPRYSGTFSTNLYYKGFSLYALFSFRLGQWVYNTTRASKVEGSKPTENADKRVFDSRWKNPGDNALYRDIADTSTDYMYYHTDRFAEEENTLTLGTLNLSYQFDEKFCKKLHLRNLRAGINMTDVFRLSTVKIERGTSYLYSKGFEIFVNATF